MGWDDFLEIGLDLAGGLLTCKAEKVRGFDAMVTACREETGKPLAKSRYQLHLTRFTGESGWYRCRENDFSRMKPGACAHFEIQEPDFITECIRWTQTPEQISQKLIEDKGD